jgi:hypothetical protein
VGGGWVGVAVGASVGVDVGVSDGLAVGVKVELLVFMASVTSCNAGVLVTSGAAVFVGVGSTAWLIPQADKTNSPRINGDHLTMCCSLANEPNASIMILGIIHLLK